MSGQSGCNVCSWLSSPARHKLESLKLCGALTFTVGGRKRPLYAWRRVSVLSRPRGSVLYVLFFARRTKCHVTTHNINDNACIWNSFRLRCNVIAPCPCFRREQGCDYCYLSPYLTRDSFSSALIGALEAHSSEVVGIVLIQIIIKFKGNTIALALFDMQPKIPPDVREDRQCTNCISVHLERPFGCIP